MWAVRWLDSEEGHGGSHKEGHWADLGDFVETAPGVLQACVLVPALSCVCTWASLLPPGSWGLNTCWAPAQAWAPELQPHIRVAAGSWYGPGHLAFSL